MRLIFFFLVVGTMLGSAQIVLEGNVKEVDGSALEFVSIQLRALPDLQVVARSWSEANGNWSLSVPKEGSWLIRAELIGYQAFSKEISVPASGKVQVDLQPETRILQGVTVSARVPLLTKKADRTVVNVEAMIGVAGQSAVEALERSPGVLVDANGNIKLKGRDGAQIFIDDKPTYLSGEELANYLRSLPAGNIKSIEIMPNPPARFEAAGNAGIINIITKKEQTLGYTGNMQVAGYQGRYTRTNSNGSLNFHSKRFGIFSNFGYRTVTGFHDLTIYRYYQKLDGSQESSFVQNSYLKWAFGTPSARLSFDYYLSPRTTLGATVRGVYNPQEHHTMSQSRIGSGNLDSLTNLVRAENLSERVFRNGTYNLNMRHQFGREGWSLNADADLVTYRTTNDQRTNNLVYESDGKTLLNAEGLVGTVPSQIEIYAFKTDFSRPLQRGAKMDIGVKTAFTHTDNTADYFTKTPDTLFRNFELTNRFIYDEWINAAYVNVQQSLDRWDLQLGLRLENTQLRGDQLGNDIIEAQSFTRDYLSLFPTLFVSYKADTLDKHVWGLNYGRRIDRPFFQDLNPFISPLDKFTYYTGNPNLVPTFAHSFALSHTYLSKFTTTLTYALTLDGINETLEIKDGIYYSRPGNVSKNNLINLSVEGSLPVKKWWITTFYVEAGHNRFDSRLYTEHLASRGNYWLVQGTQQFPLPKDWTIELTGNYQSKYVYAQLLLGNVGQVGIGASKKVLKQKGSLKLNVSDVFFTNQPFGTINNLRLTNARWTGFLDSRGATLSFSYRFGKPLKGAKGKYDGSGSGDEQKRVKS